MGFDSRPDYNLAAAATFLALCCVVVPLRFYARWNRKSGWGIDDWLTIPALLMVIGCAITIIIGVRSRVLGYPLPKPSGQQDPKKTRTYNFTHAEQLEWAFFLMQILSMGFVKLSFIYFFRRIFVHGKKSRFATITMVAIVVTVLWTLAFFFWFLFSCGSHLDARWTTIATLHDSCSTDVASDFSLAITDMLMDAIILAMPVPLVLRLNMKLSRKLAVLAIFGLGTLTLVASVVRFALFTWVLRLAAGIVKDNGADEDLLITRAMYWSMIESGLALIACCLPALSVLTHRQRIQSAPQFEFRREGTFPRFRRVQHEPDPPTLGFSDSMLKVSQFNSMSPKLSQTETETGSGTEKEEETSTSKAQTQIQIDSAIADHLAVVPHPEKLLPDPNSCGHGSDENSDAMLKREVSPPDSAYGSGGSSTDQSRSLGAGAGVGQGLSWVRIPSGEGSDRVDSSTSRERSGSDESHETV